MSVRTISARAVFCASTNPPAAVANRLRRESDDRPFISKLLRCAPHSPQKSGVFASGKSQSNSTRLPSTQMFSDSVSFARS